MIRADLDGMRWPAPPKAAMGEIARVASFFHDMPVLRPPAFSHTIA